MKCPICKNGETSPGVATVTLERGGLTLVVKAVPAQVCDKCGEEWIDDATARRLEQVVNEARAQHREVEVIAFA